MPVSRKEFLKISSFISVTYFLNACGFSDEKTNDDNGTIKNSNTTDSLAINKVKNSNHVLYITKDDEQFNDLRQGFCKRFDKKPLIIAVCLTTEGVKEAVLLAKEQSLPVSIKSGGHCFEDFSVNEGGLVINLSQLKTFELNKDGLLTIGAGYKLGEVYDKLLEHNRIIPAGSCSGVGISGLTLGGGYGLFSRELGLTCDSLIEAEIITADGKLITATPNSDLLWALKGGGNGNFGVVTQFKFQTHPAPTFLQSTRFKSSNLTLEKTKLLLQTWFEVAAQLPNDCFSAFVLNGQKLTILITNTKSQESRLTELFQKLSVISNSTKTGNETPLKAAIEVFKGQQKPIYFKNASVGLYRSYDDIAQVADAVIEKILYGKGLIYQINTLGGNITNETFEKNSSYPYRSFPFLSELQSYWNQEKKTKEYMGKFQEIQQLFFDAGIHQQYVNYPAIENPEYEIAYYGENLEKLKRIKKEFDPSDFFHYAQSIKIS
jgi:hypothetical protein